MTREWEPTVYRKSATLQWQLAQELLSRDIAWRGDEMVLDVGCGDGAVTASIAERASNGVIHGIDFSEDMIHHAKETYQQKTNLRFSVQSAENITAENQYDMVVSFSTLQWVSRLDWVIAGIHRSLKKGGKALILFYPHCFFYIGMLQAVSQKTAWQTHFKNFSDGYYCYDVDALRILLLQQNFKIERVEAIARQWQYESIAEYRLFTQGYAPHYRYLKNADLQNQFLDDVSTEIARYLPPAANGSFIIPFRSIECLVTKT